MPTAHFDMKGGPQPTDGQNTEAAAKPLSTQGPETSHANERPGDPPLYYQFISKINIKTLTRYLTPHTIRAGSPLPRVNPSAADSG